MFLSSIVQIFRYLHNKIPVSIEECETCGKKRATTITKFQMQFGIMDFSQSAQQWGLTNMVFQFSQSGTQCSTPNTLSFKHQKKTCCLDFEEFGYPANSPGFKIAYFRIPIHQPGFHRNTEHCTKTGPLRHSCEDSVSYSWRWTRVEVTKH